MTVSKINFDKLMAAHALLLNVILVTNKAVRIGRPYTDINKYDYLQVFLINLYRTKIEV